MKKSAFFPLLLCLTISAYSQKAFFPKPSHILIVIEENHGLDDIIGSPNAPYLNQLASEGALFTNSHGVMHPSQPNYIAFFSGSTQGVVSDNCLIKTTPFKTSNLGAALIKAHHTIGGFAETMPSVGFTGCRNLISDLTGAYLYDRKHCPWVNWQGRGVNNFPNSVGKPMTEFPTDFNQLPTVSFVIPNQDNDMHNNHGDDEMIRRGDDWLKSYVEKYVQWAKSNNSLLIVTFDEDRNTKQNHIPTIFVGPMVKSGKYDVWINHYSVLRTIEAMYHLTKSGPAREKAITGVWKK